MLTKHFTVGDELQYTNAAKVSERSAHRKPRQINTEEEEEGCQLAKNRKRFR